MSEYQDGLGKIVTRAKMDLSDEKRITITALPFGSTTESLMDSIEKAAKNDKVKIASINDYTSDSVNIEIKLARGVYSKDVVDSLYAYTECEQTIYCNLLVIRDNMPVQMTVTDVIKFHAKQLVVVLRDELTVERAELMEKLHLRTLERIFIEERIYKKIEQMKTQEDVVDAVKKGFLLKDNLADIKEIINKKEAIDRMVEWESFRSKRNLSVTLPTKTLTICSKFQSAAYLCTILIKITKK